MSIKFSHTSNLTKAIIIVEFVLVGYLIYSLTKNVYESYKIDSLIAEFNEENRQIEEENKQKTEDYLYFTSEEYIDKIAKQNLGLINPGEEVIILADSGTSSDIELEDEEMIDYAKKEELSNSQLWWRFFFMN